MHKWYLIQQTTDETSTLGIFENFKRLLHKCMIMYDHASITDDLQSSVTEPLSILPLYIRVYGISYISSLNSDIADQQDTSVSLDSECVKKIQKVPKHNL